MFKELFPLAAQGAFSLLLSADEASGLMTVVVVPKHSEGGKDVPALAMPLKLTAAPDELDAGFVQALVDAALVGPERAAALQHQRDRGVLGDFIEEDFVSGHGLPMRSQGAGGGPS